MIAKITPYKPEWTLKEYHFLKANINLQVLCNMHDLFHSGKIYNNGLQKSIAKGHFQVATSFCFKARLSVWTTDMKMIFYSHAKKLIFTKKKKGFALSLIFKVRVLELRNVLFNKDNKIIYHINANEIPGELSRKNLI